jgi:(p)ppGpp synthase/HD superfamily hydrolase
MIVTYKEFCYLEYAKALAAWVHKGQVRKKNHAPYITHPVRVSAMGAALGYPLYVLIALLWHDVIEDGPKEVQTPSGLLQKAIEFDIPEDLASAAIKIVVDLTRHQGESKDEYIERIHREGDQYSVLGKVLDRIDNLREGRASMPTSWLKKYLIGTEAILQMACHRGFSGRPEVQWLSDQSVEASEFITGDDC